LLKGDGRSSTWKLKLPESAKKKTLTLSAGYGPKSATEAWRAQRRVYRDLRRQKRKAFWQSTVDAEKSNPRCLWQSIDTLLGRGFSLANEEISAHCFHKYFEDKVASVRASTESAQVPDCVSGPPGVSLCIFDPVAEAIRKSPNKNCAADPVPTSVLKQNHS